MLTARDIMTRDVITASPDMEIIKATEMMLEHKVNGLPVMEDGRLTGIISQSDLMAQQKKLSLPSVFTFLDGFIPLTSMKNMEREVEKLSAVTVGQAMTKDPITVTPETNLEDVATIMIDKKIHTIPVVENGELVGIIGKEDVLKTILPDK